MKIGGSAEKRPLNKGDGTQDHNPQKVILSSGAKSRVEPMAIVGRQGSFMFTWVEDIVLAREASVMLKYMDGLCELEELIESGNKEKIKTKSLEIIQSLKKGLVGRQDVYLVKLMYLYAREYKYVTEFSLTLLEMHSLLKFKSFEEIFSYVKFLASIDESRFEEKYWIRCAKGLHAKCVLELLASGKNPKLLAQYAVSDPLAMRNLFAVLYNLGKMVIIYERESGVGRKSVSGGIKAMKLLKEISGHCKRILDVETRKSNLNAVHASSIRGILISSSKKLAVAFSKVS